MAISMDAGESPPSGRKGDGPGPSPHPAVPLTSIVMLTLNEVAYTKLCLESIARYTPEPHEILVVDNGSRDGTTGYLKGVRGVRLIANAENRGFAAGCNQGMRAAAGERILLLNNDCLVTPGWLGGLHRALDSASAVGMVGPTSNYVSGPQLDPDAVYRTTGDLLRYAQEKAARERGRVSRVARLVGFCLLFPRPLVVKIGLFDERFGRGNFEDDDYCRRAILAGYHLLIAHEVFIHHFGSRTFQANGIDYTAEMDRNRAIYLAKWMRPPDPRPAPEKQERSCLASGE